MLFITFTALFHNPRETMYRYFKYIRYLLPALAFLVMSCSSAKQPLRPEKKKKNRNCDCSPWSYNLPANTKPTCYFYG